MDSIIDGSASAVLSEPLSGWPDYIPLSAVVIVDALGPDGKRHLVARGDSDSPRWVHRGMVDEILDSLVADSNAGDYDEDDDDDPF